MPIVTYYLNNGHTLHFRRPDDDFEHLREMAGEVLASGKCFVEEQVLCTRGDGRRHRMVALIPSSALATVVIEDPIVDPQGPEFASQHVEVS